MGVGRTTIWQAMLMARLRQPVEQVLLPSAAEAMSLNSARSLRKRLGLESLPEEVSGAIQSAARWAAAANRPGFPDYDIRNRYPKWQQACLDQPPLAIHPLTGDEIRLDETVKMTPDQLTKTSLDHYQGLIHGADSHKTGLAFWRFGPEIKAPEISQIWPQLPADPRMPDHVIYDHQDLTVALTGAFAADDGKGPALLAVSLGPVQEFISSARSTSDLWAGSHLLSRMAWEAMKVICEQCGPEAIIFPRLRGVPQVDLWLRDECGLNAGLFESCEWQQYNTDQNPLFSAALPNRFTALVPAGLVPTLGAQITERVRTWVLEQGEAVFRLLLEAAELSDSPELPGYTQLGEQLRGFPEVHWAAIPCGLTGADDQGGLEASSSRLQEALQPFFEQTPPGYLGTPAWKMLSKGLKLENDWNWEPDQGALYPALHDLLERVLAGSKSLREFEQTDQHGWRDSLSGEAEWLTHDRDHLNVPPGQRDNGASETLWAKVAANKRGWARKGEHLSAEHLSALNSIKRLWPTIVTREVATAIDRPISRFVVSTHAMALTTSLTSVIENNIPVPEPLGKVLRQTPTEQIALPPRLANALSGYPDGGLLRSIPGWFDSVMDSQNETDQVEAQRLLKSFLGHAPETYYGLILMDGDQMGGWLSADKNFALRREQGLHPAVHKALTSSADNQPFIGYARELQATSPARHMAISDALNNFALHLAPQVVQKHHNGRLLYAGGDDLMAMLPVAGLLESMAALRATYSGVEPSSVGLDIAAEEYGFTRLANGFVRHDNRLLRVMGERATASCGAVIAHQKAPLIAVLRELRLAEQRAKNEGGRDAFSLTVIKRSGGALYLTAKWGESMRTLLSLRAFFADPGVSRRAAYNVGSWLRDLPPPSTDNYVMLEALLVDQFSRQAKQVARDYHHIQGLARQLASLAASHPAPISWLENFLGVGEFLARNDRGGD